MAKNVPTNIKFGAAVYMNCKAVYLYTASACITYLSVFKLTQLGM